MGSHPVRQLHHEVKSGNAKVSLVIIPLSLERGKSNWKVSDACLQLINLPPLGLQFLCNADSSVGLFLSEACGHLQVLVAMVGEPT